MKKHFVSILALLLALTCSACGPSASPSRGFASSQLNSASETIFPSEDLSNDTSSPDESNFSAHVPANQTPPEPLGNAQIQVKSSPIYAEKNLAAEQLGNVLDPASVSFYSNDEEWAYIEYNGIYGWVQSKDFIFPPSEDDFISWEEAQGIAVEAANISNSDSITFGDYHITEDKGNVWLWYVEFTDSEGNFWWYLINATSGSVHAYQMVPPNT